MTFRPPTACANPTCPNHATVGKWCADCAKNAPETSRAQYDKTHPFHDMYTTPLWKHPVTGLRACTLRKNPICVECKRAPANTADHIRDHRGDWRLFSDPNNLRGVCGSCHSKKTGSQHGIGNRRGLGVKSGADENGLVIDPMTALLKGEKK